MLRPQIILLSVLCLLLCVSYFPTRTSMSQATNHSLSLNGTSAYMSVPNSTSINISGPITIEAWIKVNAITANYQEIVYRHTWQVPGTGGGYEFTITNTGKVRLDLYQSHNQYTTCIGSTTITTGNWHHVAGVFDGNQMRVYLNGVLDGSLWTTSGPASGNSPLKIGWNTGGTFYFGGLEGECSCCGPLYSAERPFPNMTPMQRIFAGSERIGQVNASGPASVWHNFDPVTGDLLSTISNGSLWDRTTLDPGGADVGDFDPFPPDGSADPDGLVSESPAGGKNGILGAGGGRSNCVLDGIEVDCSFIRGETSVQCPDNDCGPKWNPEGRSPDGSRGAFEHFHAFVNGYGRRMTHYGRYHYRGGSEFPDAPGLHELPPEMSTLVQRRPSSFQNNPKKPSPPFNIGGIRNGLAEALKKYECREFIQNLLEAAETKKNLVAESGDIMSLFEKVVTLKGFTRNAPPGSAGPGNPMGRINDNDAAIYVYGSPSYDPATVLGFDTEGAFHELMHHAGSNSYFSDAQFAFIVF